jgi:hypothetical protein
MSSTLAGWAQFPHDGLVASTTSRVRSREPLVVGAIFTLAYLVCAIWIALNLGTTGDSLARVANAHFVLFSRDPHLGAIGFVWNPLPSLMALPLVALKGLWPNLVTDGLAAGFVSAPFGGISAAYLLKILARLEVPRWSRQLLVLFYALNPLVIYYAANGMTEIILIASLLGALHGVLVYLEDRHVLELVKSALWLLFGFGVRYEVVPWALGTVIAVSFALSRVENVLPAERQRQWVKGLAVVWLAPLVYGATTWLFLNWAIMGDALYFLNSSYSNASQLGSDVYSELPAARASGDIAATLAFGLRQTWIWPPAIIGIVGVVILALVRRSRSDTWAPTLAGASISLIAFQLLMVYLGASAGWLRFFLTLIPFGLLSLSYLARQVQQRWSTMPFVIVITLVCVGNIFSGYVLVGNRLKQEPLMRFEEHDHVVAALERWREGTVLVDSFLGFPIVLRSDDPSRFVITSDRDFTKVMNDPQRDVDAILVPRPVGLGAADAINRRYPDLWEDGASWARLVADLEVSAASTDEHWRLYAVVDDSSEG